MNRSLEAGYGSPQCPEVVGTAQQALADFADVPEVPFAKKLKSSFVVKREVPSAGFEPVMTVEGRAPRNEEQPDEAVMLRAYQDAYADVPTVAGLHSVEDTGMVPPQFGVELGFETADGNFFTSTGKTVEHAMADGIAYSLLPKEK